MTAIATTNGVPRTLGKLNYKFGDKNYRTNFTRDHTQADSVYGHEH